MPQRPATPEAKDSEAPEFADPLKTRGSLLDELDARDERLNSSGSPKVSNQSGSGGPATMPRVPVMSVAHEVRAIAQSIIAADHPHLREANIVYVFTDQRRKRCDRVRLGSAAKMNSVQRFLASGMDSVEDGPDFMILVDSNQWVELSKKAREALVDHELCHCAVFVKDDTERPAVWLRWTIDMPSIDSFEEWRYGLRGHDIEEFGEVLARHGFWRHDPQELAFESIALQMKLPDARTNGSTRKQQPVSSGV